MKNLLIVNALALLAIIRIVIWGSKLNAEHQRQWNDADINSALNDTIGLQEGAAPQIDHGCPLGWQYHKANGILDTCFDSDASWQEDSLKYKH